MGWETVAFVERDKFCQKVLRKNFGQDIEIHDDILTFSGKPFRGAVDIITGGFPCQPFSAAGKRKGRDDERHLFPEMLRVISEVRPRWVVAENVRGLLSIESGEVFSEVVSSLEGEGYEVVTFCVPASAVEAPHRRDRLWFVAHSTNDTENVQLSTNSVSRGSEVGEQFPGRLRHSNSITTDAVGVCAQGREDGSRQIESRRSDWRESWVQAATRLCRMDDVVPNRVDRLKSLGNSIVPQIAYEIFKAIESTQVKRRKKVNV